MPRTRSFVMTLLLASGLAGASTAQEPVTGRVSGFVRDIRNQPIAGATVMLVDTKTGTLTNTDGQYSLISTPGMVSLRVTARGFKPIPVTSLRLIANDLVTQDFRLDESEPRLLPYPGFFTGDQVDDPVQYIGGPLPKYPDSLKAAKIDEETADPPGGRIDKDAGGRITGLVPPSVEIRLKNRFGRR